MGNAGACRVVERPLSPALRRLPAGALDGFSDRPLREDAAEVRLVLDRSLEIRLHVHTLGRLLRGRFDRRRIQLLAAASRLDALGAHGLGAGARDTDGGFRARALAIERDRGGDTDDGVTGAGTKAVRAKRFGRAHV